MINYHKSDYKFIDLFDEKEKLVKPILWIIRAVDSKFWKKLTL